MYNLKTRDWLNRVIKISIIYIQFLWSGFNDAGYEVCCRLRTCNSKVFVLKTQVKILVRRFLILLLKRSFCALVVKHQTLVQIVLTLICNWIHLFPPQPPKLNLWNGWTRPSPWLTVAVKCPVCWSELYPSCYCMFHFGELVILSNSLFTNYCYLPINLSYWQSLNKHKWIALSSYHPMVAK